MNDFWTRYELAAEQLLAQLGKEHQCAAEVRSLQMRLGENIGLTRRWGDTETRRAERAEICANLDRVAVAFLHINFNDLLSPPKRAAETNRPVPPPPRPPAAKPRQPGEPELVRVPAGTFLMGSDPRRDRNAQVEEQPQQRLHLPEYCIARTPVTNAQYVAFVWEAGYRPPQQWREGYPVPGQEDHPVVNISWNDAMAYCHWLTETTGRRYTLPTEAQWERAARGLDGRIYPWGNAFNTSRCNTAESGIGGTTPVGWYSPGGDSPCGCVDMAGNVWEWCLTKWRDNYHEPEDNHPGIAARRVARGGAWNGSRVDARTAARAGGDPLNWSRHMGFRCAMLPDDA